MERKAIYGQGRLMLSCVELKSAVSVEGIAEKRKNVKKTDSPQRMNKGMLRPWLTGCRVSGDVRSILDMCEDINYIISISSSILFTEKCREKIHADRMATNRPNRMGVWIRPNSDIMLLPACVVFTDRRRAGLPFRNTSQHSSIVYTHKHCIS